VVSVAAFGLIANAIVQAGDGNDSAAAASMAVAAVLVPALFLVVGLVSRTQSPWRTAGVWGVVSIGIFVVATFAAREPATGYVLAIAIGVSRVMRADDETADRSWRMWTAIGLGLYTKAVYLLAPALAIVAAPLLPIAGIAIIDSVAERQLGR